jgi:hypothetical protein
LHLRDPSFMNRAALRLAKQSAIEGALPTVATVLCRLIFEYENIDPYMWQSDDPPLIIGNHWGAELIPRWVIDLHSNMQRLVHLDTGEDEDENPWYTFVSTVDLRRGARHWIVGFTKDASESNGWLGAGVTTSSTSYVNFENPDCFGISRDNSWIVRLDSDKSRPIDICHAGRSKESDDAPNDGTCTHVTSEVRLTAGCPDDSWIEFVADRSMLCITARFFSDQDNHPFVVVVAGTPEEFDLLRPCVVLAGRVAATIVSEI